MICTATATTSPSSTMNTIPRTPVGRPRACAETGSSESNRNGFQIRTRTTRTTALIPMSHPRSGLDTDTICPVSRLKRLALRPSYSDRNRIPSPSPNGMSTPTIELRSRARAPRSPISTAATSAPPIDPATTLPPNSRAAAAPANDSSLTPCTANARSRCITNTPTRPPTIPSTAPAAIEFASSATSAP